MGFLGFSVVEDPWCDGAGPMCEGALVCVPRVLQYLPGSLVCKFDDIGDVLEDWPEQVVSPVDSGLAVIQGEKNAVDDGMWG
ncbi:hypothetical protein M427DRAFT_59316 [Gonapodya prolifera JEL478]|uniref:Uncharacterized protein n=1 Tax=Gonapodya prolifera (strain JEL478) TaxID=1344416 RepID=A0A139A156_GONPJ|nr:hypothetical protein M427DRAFT_62557 [Gonapodya prolifera JEL478]KXS12574.1 hypothetical protein M427DRAFT_59316 [Gonapodya prolifera JEL478]|eukprot:KXS10255.1 hypothetical protein M427DRAFT_62557 [Gonapodya prolifera JEL478]